MKLICSSDWHLDAVTDGLRRFDDLRAAVEESLAEALRVKAAAYLMLGDLCDPTTVRSFRAIAYACNVARRLREAGIVPVFLTGNHDVVEDGSGDHVLLALAEAGARVVAEPTHFAIHGQGKRPAPIAYVVALPYTPASHSYDPAAEVARLAAAVQPGYPVLVVGHLNLEGIAPGSESTAYARGRDVFWPLGTLRERLPDALLVGGHYHRRQVYEGVQIVGSLCRLTHGEEQNRPGYLVVEV
jgi:DNA repair exonuclease SbcCD nuclease subunit